MSEKEIVDVGDEHQVKSRKTKAQLKHENEVEQVRRLLQEKGNRAVIYRFLEMAGLTRTLSYADSHTMAVRSGVRDAALWWIDRMKEADPNAFVLMQYEAIQREDDDG